MTHVGVISRTLAEHDLYDTEIVSHGFVPQMRDYRLVVERFEGTVAGRYVYTFRGCVEVAYCLTLPPDAVSLDDSLLDATSAAMPASAFQWHAATACVDGAATLAADSPRAVSWTARLGQPMAEVSIETNVYRLSLVFHDLDIQRVTAERPDTESNNA